MPRQSFARLPADRRGEIIRIAAEEFAEHGYHGTSYNRLLSRLGLGKSSAYHYFEDKADLFRMAVSERYTAFFESVAALTPPGAPQEFWPFIERVNLLGFRFMIEDPVAVALMQCFTREASNLDQVLASEQVLAAIDQYHRGLLSLGQSLGVVRTDLPLEQLSLLSRTLGSAADQAFVAELRRDGAAKVARRLRALAAEWTDAYRRLFEPSPPAKRPAKRARPRAKTRSKGAGT